MTKNEVKDVKGVPQGNAKSEPEPSEKAGASEFLKSTKAEFEKIVWPSRQELISESAAVLLMVVAAATLVYLVDGLFSWIAVKVF